MTTGPDSYGIFGVGANTDIRDINIYTLAKCSDQILVAKICNGDRIINILMNFTPNISALNFTY